MEAIEFYLEQGNRQLQRLQQAKATISTVIITHNKDQEK